MKVTYPLRLFFDCSTAHLAPATRRWLDARAVDAAARQLSPINSPAATPFGWFLWAENPPHGDTPDDLAAVMVEARRLGAEYILLDCDAPENSALPVFDEPG